MALESTTITKLAAFINTEFSDPRTLLHRSGYGLNKVDKRFLYGNSIVDQGNDVDSPDSYISKSASGKVTLLMLFIILDYFCHFFSNFRHFQGEF